MIVSKEYNRERAVLYAEKYAFSQNPIFGNFSEIGGNCTNFVSQCIYAGSCRMNYTKNFGWYYISYDERAPAWTGVDFFYDFITTNIGVGPYGMEVQRDMLDIGDVIQLGMNQGGYYHTLLVVEKTVDDILVAAQTDNAYRRPLSTYSPDYLRYIKILGVRLELPDTTDCFDAVYNGIAIISDALNTPSTSEINNE